MLECSSYKNCQLNTTVVQTLGTAQNIVLVGLWHFYMNITIHYNIGIYKAPFPNDAKRKIQYRNTNK